MTTQASPSSAASRSRQYRARKQDGIIVVAVDVCEKDLVFLAQTGIIEDCDRVDRAQIGKAIEELLTWLGAGVFDIDEAALDRVLQGDV